MENHGQDSVALTDGDASGVQSPNFFVGRDEELHRLRDALEGTLDVRRKRAPLLVIHGMGGVGKSTLAASLAASVKGSFPDGVFQADLSSARFGDFYHLPGRNDLEGDIGDTLACFLLEMGVAEELMPPTLYEREALFRSLTSKKQVLIILDNVDREELIEPFIPRSGDSAVVVTSRVALRGRRPDLSLALGPLRTPESMQVLERALRRPIKTQELRTATEIVELVGGLPLALTILGASVRDHEESLAGNRSRDLNSLLGARDGPQGIRDVFAWAFERLSLSQRRLLIEMSILDVSDFSAALAATATKTPLASIGEDLDRTVNSHFVDCASSGRFRFHPIIRSFLRLRALSEYEPDISANVVSRALKWYASVAAEPGAGGIAGSEMGEDEHREPDGASGEWVSLERRNILACIRQGAVLAQWQDVRDLARAVSPLLRMQEYIDDLGIVLEFALAAERNLGALDSEASLLAELGLTYRLSRRNSDALQAYQASLRAARDRGEKIDEARALIGLAELHADEGQVEAAVSAYEDCLTIVRQNSDKKSEARVFCRLGGLYLTRSRPEDALAAFDQALWIFRSVGDRSGQAHVLLDTGRVLTSSGADGPAVHAFEGAENLFRELDDARGEAVALELLAGVFARQGESIKAIASYEESLRMLRELGLKYDEVRVLGSMASVWSEAGHHDQAIDVYEQALSLSTDMGDIALGARLRAQFGVTYLRAGRVDDAVDTLQGAVTLWRRLGSVDSELPKVLGNLGIAYWQGARWTEAVQAFEEAVTLGRLYCESGFVSRMLCALGETYRELERWNDAVEVYEEALSLWRSEGELREEAKGLRGLAGVYVSRNMPGEAVHILERAVELWHRAGASDEAERDAVMLSAITGEPTISGS